MKNKDSITISELSYLTDIPASTIRFYLREGLITSPLRKGKTRAYYNKEHVIQLKKLKKLRSKNNLSIEEIRQTHRVFVPKAGENGSDQSSVPDRKDDIITTAIELFRSKGYDHININDIAEKASISKATFYKHFSGKEELFYECAERVFDIDKEFKELLNEKDVVKRLILRSSLFIKTHRHMIDMLQMIRGTSAISEPKHRLKLKQIITNLAVPIANDLEEGIKHGLFKRMNTTIVAYIIMGAAEYGFYFLEGKSEAEIEDFIKRGVSLILQGMNPENDRRQ